MITQYARTCAALALFLASFGAFAASDEPIALDNNFKAADLLPTLFKPTGDVAGLKDMRRVAITGFDVEFVTKGAASANSMRVDSGNRVQTAMTVTLTKVDEHDFQGLVDQLYADFVRDLQAAGLELVPTAQMKAAPSYAQLAGSGSPAPMKKSGGGETSTVFSAEERAVFGDSLRGKGVFGAFAGLSSAKDLIQGGLALQKDLDATLLNVHIVVNFVDMSSSNSSFFGKLSGTAKVAGKINPAIVPGSTQLSLQGGAASAGVQFRLQRGLRIDSAAIPNLKDNTSVATNVGLAVLSLALGGHSSGSVVEKEAEADPDRYRELVGAGLGNVRELLVEQIKRVR